MHRFDDVSSATQDRIRQIHGEGGARWLTGLANRLVDLSGLWSLEIDETRMSSASLVARATSSRHGAVILKLAIDEAAFSAELAALEAFSGNAVVRLLEKAPIHHAMLLERVVPGEPLSAIANRDTDEEPTRIAVGVFLEMQASARNGERSAALRDIGQEGLDAIRACRTAYRDGYQPIPARTLAMAEGMICELNPSEHEVSILHGDLHHDNILRSDRNSWLAIDPKGRVGDPASELAALIRNPIDELRHAANLRRFLARRIDQLVDLTGYDRIRVHGWALALTVVAACWQLEDREPGWEQWLLVADALK